MGIKLGANSADKFYLGITEVPKIYLGAGLVFEEISSVSGQFTLINDGTERTITFMCPSGESVDMNGTTYNGNDDTGVDIVTTDTTLVFTESTAGCIAYFSAGGMDLEGDCIDFSLNTNLTTVTMHYNLLTGDIPDLTACTSLANYKVYHNQITGFAGGNITISNKLYLHDNALTVEAVDDILRALVDGGTTNATIKLETGNGIPTATGEGYIDTLRGDGCTVSVEGGY